MRSFRLVLPNAIALASKPPCNASFESTSLFIGPRLDNGECRGHQLNPVLLREPIALVPRQVLGITLLWVPSRHPDVVALHAVHVVGVGFAKTLTLKHARRQPDGIHGKSLCRDGCCHQGFGCGPPVWELMTKKPPPSGWRDSEPQAFAHGGYTGSATRA